MKYSKQAQKMCYNMLLTDGAICVMQNSLRREGCVTHLTRDLSTFLCWHMSIGYLEPLVHNRFPTILE